MRCAVGSWGGQRPSLAGYVTVTGAKPGAPAAARRRRAFMLPILLFHRILVMPITAATVGRMRPQAILRLVVCRLG